MIQYINTIPYCKLGNKILKYWWGGDLLDKGLEAANIKNPLLKEGIKMGLYFVPGLGQVLAAGDMYDSAKAGDAKGVVLNGLMAIPGIGMAGKLLNSTARATKIGKVVNTAEKASKAINTAKGTAAYSAANKAYGLANKGAAGYIGAEMVGMGKQMYEKAKEFSNYAKDIKEMAKASGMSVNEFLTANKNILADSGISILTMQDLVNNPTTFQGFKTIGSVISNG